MKKYRRKMISLLLTAAMLITAVPILAAPDGDDYPAAPDEIIQTEAIAAEAAEAETTETILTTEPEVEAIDAAANDGVEPVAEAATAAPTRDPNEKFYLINANYREHPSTSSIFNDDVPNKLFWVEFSNKVDHKESYDKTSKTYNIDGNYYQLVIERPEHGPSADPSGATPHPAASMVPDNGVDGFISDMLTGNNNEHRYHGWEVGSENLFHQDTTPEYQVGEYTAKLYRVTPENNSTPAPGLENCDKTFVNSKTINIVQVTYTLSDEDKGKNYKLICANHPDEKTDSITELATVGDWITIIDPSLDYTEVQDLNGQTRKIVGWNIVKDGGQTTPIGNAVPSDNETSALFDEKQDNKITLEAVINEPKSYSYEFQKNDDNGTAAFPTAPPATSEEPKPTAPPASYNQLISANGEAEKIEYEPAATVTPLVLRLKNTGNQRIYVRTWTQDSNFTVETTNVNKDKDSANELGTDKTIFYIPTANDLKSHSDWKDYAEVTITPRQGLAAGTYTTQINAMNQSGGGRVTDTYNLTVTIGRKEVKVAPQSREKEYGLTLTPADIMCDVYDSADIDIGKDLTAAELGITLECEGMKQEAAVNGGNPYAFTGIEDVELDSGNFDVKLKEGTQAGITVTKATPTINRPVTATGITDGKTLSSSKLDGAFVNRNSHLGVDGKLEWVEPGKTIKLNGSGSVTEYYKFIPNDQDNFNVVENQPVTIVVSQKNATNITMSSTEKTYNGKPQAPTFKWNRGSAPEIGRNIQVVYKLVTDGNGSFEGDTNFDESEGYTSDPPTNAGTYKVHVTSNENEIFADGLLNAVMTIKPYTLNSNKLTLSNVIDKVYDGTDAAIADTSKIKYTKPKPEDEVYVVQGALRGTYINANADPFYVKNATLNVLTQEQFEKANPEAEVPATYPLAGKDAANYTLSNDTMHITGRISRRPLKLVLNGDIQKHYGETHTFAASDCKPADDQAEGGGLAETDTIDKVKFELYTDQNVETSAGTVGNYDVKIRIPSGITEYNYELDTSKPVGKIVIGKTMPHALSVSSDSGIEGTPLQNLGNFTGTFENPYNQAILQNGTLEWVNPQEKLTKGKSKYEWKYTPEDQANYDVLTGEVEIAVGDKPIAQIVEFNVPTEITYDGEPHPVTIKSDVESATTTVEYRKLDIELHDAQAQDEGWDMTPPVNAGTYQVRGTVYATDEYAENSKTETMTILQAEPEGTVTASNVNKGDFLSSSQLDHNFTGVKDETLDGTIAWQEVGVAKPSDILIEAEGSYGWIFAPEDTNYKTVTGTATVCVNENKRAPEVTVYNIPATEIGGDYAYVNVDGENLMVGDVVTFYHDAEMSDPISANFKITEEMNGMTKVTLDNELNPSGGTIYVNIKYSDTVKEAQYKPQVGFTLSKTQIYVEAGKSDTVTIEPSDPSYVLSSASWTSGNTSAATVEAQENGRTATISGVDDGTARIDVVALFDHPDTSVSDKISVSASALVTVTEQEPPTYKYTTKDATDITESGATLNGRVDITLPEGSTITPVASCKFELWEAGSEEKTIYNNEEILRESGDYSIVVGGLKPDTEYCYRAFGAQSDTEAEVKTFTTGSAPVPTATPAPPTEAPSATSAPATAEPTPVETPEPTPTETAEPTPTETVTPAPIETATPAPIETATPAPSETATPAPIETATPAPSETATPTPSESATPNPGAPVRYDAPPVLDKDTAAATITNNSGKGVWFITAAYRDDVLIDIRFVEAPAGTNPVSAQFGSDYSADNSVSVTFYLWEKDTLKPCAPPVQGK